MDSLIDSYSKNKTLHHAYILEGEKEAIRDSLLNFIEKYLGETIQANPDLYHEKFESFSIDDARTLKERQGAKALGENRKLFIIETLSMTVEAQNSLLKVFEEPTANTHFFIITPTSSVFLPTLLSRVIVLSHEQHGQKEKNEISEAKKFVEMNLKERLEIVNEIVEEKNKSRAINLIENLIAYFHQPLQKNTGNSASLLRELLLVRSFISDRSPSLKLILEHISLIVPTI